VLFHKKSGKKLPFVILTIFVLAGLLFFLQPQWHERFLSIFDLQGNMVRINLWNAAYRIFQDHPLIGTGLGNFPAVFPDYMEGPVKNTHPTPHNLFFNILSDTGLVGLAVFIWFAAK